MRWNNMEMKNEMLHEKMKSEMGGGVEVQKSKLLRMARNTFWFCLFIYLFIFGNRMKFFKSNKIVSGHSQVY